MTATSANVPVNVTTVVIHGSGFDANFADDRVTLSSGAGVVTAASATSLTVGVTGLTAGPLSAVVSLADGAASTNTRVATVIPVVSTSKQTLGQLDRPLVIAGFGFDPTPANDVVKFSGSVTGTITSATANQLTVM